MNKKEISWLFALVLSQNYKKNYIMKEIIQRKEKDKCRCF